ncbi:MAG: Gfo/Idh/MocA family oxidoreductase [Lachnospiraceae bacterium]|nr:Gfo/Idh/MocA family oxidoreductase [Lachnospiraceae bacterium]
MRNVEGVKKILRYNKLFGFSRTVIKVAGRTRINRLNIFFPKRRTRRNVSLIGCGQFGFSTISYYLYKNVGSCFLHCYDVNRNNCISTARFWGYTPVKDWKELIFNPDCKYVYIASDHYSHSQYAIEALRAGKIVYCEKPIAVSHEQLENLKKAIYKYSGEIYFGYNRPFSKAIADLKLYIKDIRCPMTFSCLVSGHKLASDHWYNDPKEGTRICGNLGHWIDLSMYLFEVRGYVPTRFDINITCADDNEIDDNITVTYRTDFGDLVTLVLTSRTEPFEGINETINLQCGNVISKIDDFQTQTIWIDEKKKRMKYRPKDVGHLSSINQPFDGWKREQSTVFKSTWLMLEIKEMVTNREKEKVFHMGE